jgi:hypothetical protein
MNTKLEDLLHSMIDDGTIEDRREYDQQMLKTMYDLTDEESIDLEWLIMNEFDPQMPLAIRTLETLHGKQMREFLIEALHGNLDGWDSEHDRVTILRFIQDMVRFVKATD